MDNAMDNMMDEEIWKDIEGFEEKYQVSTHGRVRNVKTGRILKPHEKSNGYLAVDLMKNGKRKTCTIHRLVAKTFIPNPENKPIVNHKDGNKKNNHLSNLEWASGSENIQHAYNLGLSSGKRKLTQDDVKLIREMYEKGHISINKLAKQFCVSFVTIHHIVHGKIWKDVI